LAASVSCAEKETRTDAPATRSACGDESEIEIALTGAAPAGAADVCTDGGGLASNAGDAPAQCARRRRE
jgi:hypothetical protein